MVEKEGDLTAYIAYHSNVSNNLALISGFIFTSIVLLLTLLPDPSQPVAQLTLFILSAVSSVLVLQLFGEETLLGYCVEYAPKLPKSHPTRLINTLSPLVWVLLGVVIVLTFLVLGLVYLAVASAVLAGITNLFGYFRIMKPLSQWEQWKRVALHERED